MDARSMQLPCQINVAQGHSSRELHRLATPQREECEKILHRNNRSTKRAHEPKVFKTSNTTPLKGKKFRDIDIHVYNVRETIFFDQTGKLIPQTITKGVQVYYGDCQNRQQRNSS